MTKFALALLLMLGFVVNACADYEKSSKPGAAAAGAVSLSATVESIDYNTRHVTLKNDDGESVTLKVGELARNFNQVKKGDRVTFDYMEALAVDVRKAEGPLENQADVTLERAPLGAKPAGVISGTVTMKALVEAVDYDTRQLTLKGAEGNRVTLKVSDQVKRLNDVKKGDHVVVSYTEALGISVTPKG